MDSLTNIDKVIKDALRCELKDNFGRYMKLLQLWFQHQLSKQEFDKQARSLFPNADVTTHNRFILSIMSSCEVVEAPTKASKQTRVSKNLRHRFKEMPEMPLISLISEYQMAHAKQTAFDHGKKDFSVVTTSCIREQRLPGSWMLYGRLMNTLQLYSLQDFSPEALNCLAEAAQQLARRVLLSALASRRCCRLAPPLSPENQSDNGAPLDSPCAGRLRGHLRSAAAAPATAERVAFGRVPIPRLSLGDGYVAAVRGERLNAHLHHRTAADSAATTANGGDDADADERLRIDALLRCDPSAAARVCGAGQRTTGCATSTTGTVLEVEDFYRVVTRPDSHLVGYHCLQRRTEAVASHFVRFLSQSRALHRLRQRQLRHVVERDDFPLAALPAGSSSALASAAAATTDHPGGFGAAPPPTLYGSAAARAAKSSSSHLEKLLLDCGDDGRTMVTDFG